MKIGLDARFLTHPQRGGFKTYTVNLVNAISQLDTENEYFIYLDRSHEVDKLPMQKNFNYRVVSGTLPGIGMALREQVFLRQQVSKDDVDVFHSLCNTAPVEINAKKILTLHDTIQVTTKIRFTAPPGFKYWMIMAYSNWAITRSLRNPGLIITVSAYEKSQILKLFDIPSERIVVTHLAANEMFKPGKTEEKAGLHSLLESKFGIQRDYLMGVGYEDRKNIPLIIEAYRFIASDFPELNLVVVSAEETKRLYFQRLVKDYQLEGRVLILGALSAADLVTLYTHAKVFVFPSERESFGLPPLEAISCGTPTIAMSSSSLPEILGSGALFIDGKDAQIWSNAIRTVLTNKQIRSEMIERGLKRASELSWGNCARETIKVYNQLT